MKRILTTIIILMTLTACTKNQANMANPASVFCEQNGNKLEIQTAADGSQSGIPFFATDTEASRESSGDIIRHCVAGRL